MDNTTFLVLCMVVGIVGCSLGAAKKGRNVAGWMFGGAMFPLIALVAIFCLPPLENKEVA